MTDLIAFLSARRDEDEAVAKHAGGREWRTGCTCEGECPGYPSCERVEGDDITIYNEGGHDAYQAEHIARHDPARLLREVEADRALMAKLRQVEELGERLRVDTEILILRQVIAIRAAIWNDHPDYEGWLQ